MTHVIVSDTPQRQQFSVGGTAQATFDFAFTFFDLAHLRVYVGETLLSAADYSVTPTTTDGSGDPVDGGYPGGTVTLDVAVTNTTVTILNDLPVARTTDFPLSGPFDIASLNGELDRLTVMLQQARDGLDRTMQMAPQTPSVDLTLPAPDARRAVMWNSDGTALVNSSRDPDLAANEAEGFRDQALSYRNDAEAAKDTATSAAAAAADSATTASEWAENPEDLEVAPGEYSALHHAAKAAASATEAQLAVTDVSNKTVTPDGTTTARTVAEHLGIEVYPQDFGAAGDGVTDDGAALQAWLDALENGAKIGKLTPGTTYLFGRTLYVRPASTIIGYGATLKVVPGASTSVRGVFLSDETWLVPSHDVTLKGLTLDGSRDSRTGPGEAALLYSYGAKRATLQGVTLKDNLSDGLYIGGSYLTVQDHADTAAGGASATTVSVPNGSAVDDAYNGKHLAIYAGKGVTQERTITDYDGTSKVATVSPAFDIIPDSTSKYVIGTAGPGLAEGWEVSSVLVERAYRNGLSVVGARNCLIERSSFNFTEGAAAGPEAGIDIEPDKEASSNHQIHFKVVEVRGNKREGFIEQTNHNTNIVVDGIDASDNGAGNGGAGISFGNARSKGMILRNASGGGNAGGLFKAGTYTHDVDLIPRKVSQLWPLDVAISWNTTTTGTWQDVPGVTIDMEGADVGGAIRGTTGVVKAHTSANAQVQFRWYDIDNGAAIGPVSVIEMAGPRMVPVPLGLIDGTPYAARQLKLQVQLVNAATLTLYQFNGEFLAYNQG